MQAKCHTNKRKRSGSSNIASRNKRNSLLQIQSKINEKMGKSDPQEIIRGRYNKNLQDLRAKRTNLQADSILITNELYEAKKKVKQLEEYKEFMIRQIQKKQKMEQQKKSWKKSKMIVFADSSGSSLVEADENPYDQHTWSSNPKQLASGVYIV